MSYLLLRTGTAVVFAVFLWNQPGLEAQTKLRAGLSPVPLYPLNGDLTNAPSGTKVFLDPEGHQLVIVGADPSSGLSQLQRFDLADRASATLNSSVTTKTGGTVEYSYGVVDSAPGQHGATSVSLRLPAPASALSAAAGSMPFAVSETNLPNRYAPVEGTLRMIAWTAPAGSPSLQPAPLAIDSAYLPGFADAFIQSAAAHPLTPAAVAALPADAAQQAAPFLQPEWSSRRAFVIAPMFAPGVPKRWIVANFFAAVSSLIQSGDLQKDSPFVTQFLGSLTTYLTGAVEAAPIALPSVLPQSPLEQAIQSAARLSFGN